MADFILSFGKDGQSYYEGPKNSWWNINEGVLPKKIDTIHWFTFDESDESYLIIYTDTDGNDQLARGSDLPLALEKWLVDPSTSQFRRSINCRVALGPNRSFVAWDGSITRWSNIPTTLEARIQAYVSDNKKYGGLRLLCLGAENAYLAVTESGSRCSHGLPTGMDEALRRKSNGKTLAAALSMFDTRWIVVRTKRHDLDIAISGQINEVEEDKVYGILDPILYNDTEILERKIERLGRRIAGRDAKIKGFDATLEEHNATLKARDDRIKHLEQETGTKSAGVIYGMWTNVCDKYFAANKHTIFIECPILLERCQDKGCVARKMEPHNINVCAHEMEAVLWGSGQYSTKFLRTERLRWHPDRFIRVCDSSARHQLAAKAAQMFAIIEELLMKETGKENKAP